MSVKIVPNIDAMESHARRISWLGKKIGISRHLVCS